MPSRVILLSGPISAGKTTLAAGLADRYGAHVVKTGQLLKDRFPRLRETRGSMQRAGKELDVGTQHQWVAQDVVRIGSSLDEDAVIAVDAVRTANQIRAFRDAFGARVVHMHLSAPFEVLGRRYKAKEGRVGFKNYVELVHKRAGLA